MSRHEIPARDAAHKVIVGWDPPLATLYAQVIDRAIEAAGEDDEHDKFVLWLGADPPAGPMFGSRTGPAIQDISRLAALLAPYAELTAEIRRTLYDDKEMDR